VGNDYYGSGEHQREFPHAQQKSERWTRKDVVDLTVDSSELSKLMFAIVSVIMVMM